MDIASNGKRVDGETRLMKIRDEVEEVKLAEAYFGYKYSGIGGIFYLHHFPRARWIELAIFVQGINLFITSTIMHRNKGGEIHVYEMALLILLLVSIVLLGIIIRLDMRFMKKYFLKYRSNFPTVE